MTHHPLPCRLDEGIWLEDLDVLLPWNTKLRELRGVGSPEIVEDTKSLILHWRHHVVMGQACDVMTHQLPDDLEEHPPIISFDIDSFHWASMTWLCPAHWSADKIIQSFKSTYEQLRQLLGDATFCSPGYAYTKYASREGSLPAIDWEFGTIDVGLSAQFPPHLIDHRKHRGPDPDFPAAEFTLFVLNPEGHAELEASARCLKERGPLERKRVNGVVW